MTAEIRNATPDDVPAIVELGARFHAESHYRRIPYDVDWALGTMGRYASGHQDALLLVVHEGEDLIGFLAARIGPIIFSPRRAVIQDLLFVHPDHRSGRTGTALVERFLEWADACDPAFIDFTQSTGIQEAGFGQLMARYGFENHGTVYRRISAGN
ncbi:MAG: GNAT family N-acetyltransferase [Oceanicaulis sp.]